MTDHPTPGQPLTAESVGLLKAGDVLRHEKYGLCKFFDECAGRGKGWLIVDCEDGRDAACRPENLIFIGRPGPDGWVAAPECGWTENPVPGREVYIRQDCGWESKTASAYWDWGEPVTAFRLTPTSPPIEDAERSGDGLDRLKANLAEEIRVAAEESDATPLERHVARALTSDDAKANGLVDRVWVVSLPDARKAIAAIAEWPTDPVSDVEVRTVEGPDSFSAEGKFFMAVDHLTRETWRWGESCGIDNVSWDEAGDSYNQTCRARSRAARHALRDAFHAAVDEKVVLIARSQPKGAGQSSGDQIGDWARALYESNAFYAASHADPDDIGWDDMAPNDAGIRDLHMDMARAAKFVWDKERTTDNADGLSADREPALEVVVDPTVEGAYRLRAPAGQDLAAEVERLRHDADTLAVLLDNVVIAQSLSRELRERSHEEARSYLYNRRQALAALKDRA